MKKSFFLLLLIPFAFYSCKTKDNFPPQIYLNGDDPMYVTLEDTYEEPGATADDNFDGAGITNKIESTHNIPNTSNVTSGDCLTKKHGDWTVTYSVSDEAGNSTTKTRTVKVRNQAYIYSISEFGFQCVYNCTKTGTVNVMPNFSNIPVSLDFDDRYNNRIYFTKLAGKNGLRIYADIADNDTIISIPDQYKIFTETNGDSVLYRVRGNVGTSQILDTIPTSFHIVIKYQLEYYSKSTSTDYDYEVNGEYWKSEKYDTNTETYIQWE